MLIKKVTVLAVALVLSVSAFADDAEGPEAFSLVLGPRIGSSYIMTPPADFTSRVNALYSTGSYFPVVTLFGFNIEQRILLGNTKSHFAFQEIILIGGWSKASRCPRPPFWSGTGIFPGSSLESDRFFISGESAWSQPLVGPFPIEACTFPLISATSFQMLTVLPQ